MAWGKYVHIMAGINRNFKIWLENSAASNSSNDQLTSQDCREDSEGDEKDHKDVE